MNNINKAENTDSIEVSCNAPKMSPAEDIILNAFRDKLFLLICIFETITFVLRVILGATGLMSLARALLVVFLWLIYAKAVKGSPCLFGMHFVRGTVSAMYIVRCLLCALVLVLGILLLIVSIVVGTAIYGTVDFDSILLGENEREVIMALSDMGAFAIVLEAVALAGIVIDIICVCKIGSFAKSLCVSVKAGEAAFAKKAKKAEPWFWVQGCFYIILYICLFYLGWVLDSPPILEFIWNIIAFGISVACCFIGGILVNKYFVTARK